MVVSSHRLASMAGIVMLQRGGNAIDAAVAVGYAEAVVDPCCGNIGGGGFLVAHLADHRDVFLNFRETAPGAATHDIYLDSEGNVARQASLFGWRAVAVPGTVMGLDAALTQYGTLPRSVVMAPAIRLAREGFDLTEFDTGILRRGTALFRRDGIAAGIFLHSDGSPLQAGERLVQPTKTIITVPSGALQRVQNAWRGRRLIGAPVFGDNGEQLAVVSDQLITDSGVVEKVVLSVTLRRRLVAVPFSQLSFVPTQRTGMHAGRRGTQFETAAARPFGIMLPGTTRDTLSALETFRFVSSP